MRTKSRPGFTIVELLAVVLAVALLLGAAVPTMQGVHASFGVQQSASNLVTLGVAHVLYAADWNGRQVTSVRDDLGVFGGDMAAYNNAAGCQAWDFGPDCQPASVAGWGETAGGAYAIWAYWPSYSNALMILPMIWPDDDGDGFTGLGHFRVPNTKPFHNYLNGRYHDAALYAPNDTSVLPIIEGCVPLPDEFGGGVGPAACNPGWSSYAFSTAAMYHPDVMRSNAAGGWQNPRTLDYGFESPGLFQATYPDLKTHMLEHAWVQSPPGECNPAFSGCTPYYFNMGLASSPVTLFYDGAVRQLPNTEVLAADQQVLMQTGGVDGLWHRGTSFGADGYFISDGFDGTPLSHHILTTDGILGRDTIAGVEPAPVARRAKRPGRFTAVTPAEPRSGDPAPFTPEGGAP